jgi:hypothetical protein
MIGTWCFLRCPEMFDFKLSGLSPPATPHYAEGGISLLAPWDFTFPGIKEYEAVSFCAGFCRIRGYDRLDPFTDLNRYRICANGFT